jgi:hypothetical protein
VKLADDIRRHVGSSWIADLYRDKVRSGRTRAFHLDVPAKENNPEILHTLLGVELKVGNRRFACPDLATARYLRVFARIGCTDLAVPYDITKISVIADSMETAWHQMTLLIQKEALTSISAGRLRAALVRKLRDEIVSIGPGDIMPPFDRETKQRK